MGHTESSWHTTTAHYAVVPVPAPPSGGAPWALQRFTRAGATTVYLGTYEACCFYLDGIRERTQEEESA